jgi:hypothetical protein
MRVRAVVDRPPSSLTDVSARPRHVPVFVGLEIVIIDVPSCDIVDFWSCLIGFVDGGFSNRYVLYRSSAYLIGVKVVVVLAGSPAAGAPWR